MLKKLLESHRVPVLCLSMEPEILLIVVFLPVSDNDLSSLAYSTTVDSEQLSNIPFYTKLMYSYLICLKIVLYGILQFCHANFLQTLFFAFYIGGGGGG